MKYWSTFKAWVVSKVVLRKGKTAQSLALPEPGSSPFSNFFAEAGNQPLFKITDDIAD